MNEPTSSGPSTGPDPVTTDPQLAPDGGGSPPTTERETIAQAPLRDRIVRRPRFLPVPGIVLGAYPERPERLDGGVRRPRMLRASARRIAKRAQREAEAIVAELAAAGAQAPALPGEDAAPARLLAAHRQRAALALARRRLTGDAVAIALGVAGATLQRTMGFAPFPTQYLCAALLLDQQLAEMATGEGKTFAAALAAAVAAMAGIPVHVLTANDYLAERDCATLQPFYRALGLSAASALESQAIDTRRAAYRADVVHATARTVAFDYLRDRLQRGPRHAASNGAGRAGTPDTLMLRGLCMAIVDEADAILLDEARTPLVIAETRDDPQERARLWLALDLARQLAPSSDYRLDAAARTVTLTAAGRQRLDDEGRPREGPWLNTLHRDDLVTQALTALHALARDVDYVVDGGEVVIVDATTGRSAPGRQWSRNLHGLVALKERLTPPPASHTVAALTYPRLFARYHLLCGLSGTLTEARGELRRTYGLRVARVPRQAPLARTTLPMRLFADRDAQFTAALARVQALHALGRPVLVTTDSVEDSADLAARLAGAGLAPAVLDARHDREEAQVVARAGLTAQVTVATQMAGRGTDIALAPGVAALGGLHVLNLQHNRSARIDRQIAGRAGRQGEPGSCEHWIRVGDSPMGRPPAVPPWASGPLWRLALRLAERGDGRGGPLRAVVAARLIGAYQRACAAEDGDQRRRVLQHDLRWSQRLHFSGVAE